MQTAKVMQRRDSIPKAAHATGALNTMPSTPNPSRPAGNDITAELRAVMAKTVPTSQTLAKSQPQLATSLPSTSSQRHSAGGRPPPNGNRAGQSSRPVTQEQIIVGHFCRHAIKTLARVMMGDSLAAPLEARLKEHIKSVWAQWVRGMITRPQLLDSVAAFVRGSSPQASRIDVIRDFKAWYEREYELQKKRTNAAPAARRQQEQLQRKTNQMNALNAARNTPSSLHTAVSGNAIAGARMVQPPKHASVVRQGVKQELGMMQSLGHATGGKKIANKSVPSTMPMVAKVELQTSVAGRASAGKSVPSKVGSQNITRPPMAPKAPKTQVMGKMAAIGRGVGAGRGIAVGKSPSMNKEPVERGMPLPKVSTASKGAVGGKSLAGGKGLLSNKMPAAAKPKTSRKDFPKVPSKVSPKSMGKSSQNVGLAKPKSNAMMPPGAPLVSITGQANVGGNNKRPFDGNVGAMPGQAAKKPKANPKGVKNVMYRGEKVVTSIGASTAAKAVKPPPARPESMKNRAMKKPPLAGVPGVGPGVGSKGVGAGVGDGNAVAIKKVRRTDDGLNEISVVHNIVDIEDEEDKLGRDIGTTEVEMEEVLDYGGDMLLTGGRLRTKMQSVTKRFGLSENVSKEAMEMMSLAVRERIAGMLEALKEIAAVRVEANKQEWNTASTGINVYEEMKRRRQSEERSLQIAANMRAKRRKEQQEQEAKKQAGEATNSEKKTKDSGATAEAERKEKLALEKKRKESSSQRDALSGLLRNIDKRRKKPTLAKGLAPLEPLGKKGVALPPIPRRVGATSFGSGANSGSKKGLEPLSKLKGLPPIGKAGRNGNGGRGLGSMGNGVMAEQVKLTLRDCLFLMKCDGNTRKSSLLYKWYARIGDRRTR